MNDEFNNQANGGQQVISVERKKTNILAVLGLIFAFFIPLVGLVLSIVGLVQSKKMNDGKGIAIGGIIASAIFLVLHIIFFIAIIFIFIFEAVDDYDYDYKNNYDYDYYYRDNIDYSVFGDMGEKFYFGQNGNNFYSSTSYDEDDEFKLVGEYDCNSVYCRVFDVAHDYAVVYDDKDYFLYDYRKDKKITLNIPYKKYSHFYLHDDRDGNTLGIVLESVDFSDAFYYIKDNEVVIDFGNYKDIRVDADLLEAGYVVVSDDMYDEDKEHYLYNLVTRKIEREGILGAFSNGKVTYFYDGELSDADGIRKIYSRDFKTIVDFKNDLVYEYYFDAEEGKLLYADEHKYGIIKNNKVTYTSKTYNDVYNVLKDYVVVNKDDNLLILDHQEKEVANLVALNDDMIVHRMLSGWYTENGKKGIYVVVEDPSVKCSELDKEKLLEFGAASNEELIEYCEEYGTGYEYYYIPETKEIGKITTVIGGYAKPVLYLYPKNDNTEVRVSFEKSKLLTTTYPKYNKYWKVIANKNGDLLDENGRSYYGLYWEELGSTNVDFKEGFYVTKDDAISFLEEKLDLIGLTEREANEFIMYWLPILESNEQSLVYFELTEERENFNKLIISPTPDSLLRVAIHVKKVNKKVNIKEQKFTTFKRHGFTAVEWGGVVH